MSIRLYLNKLFNYIKNLFKNETNVKSMYDDNYGNFIRD